MPLQETKETRNISLDAARVVAVAAVLLTHVSTQFVMYYDVETAQFVWGNIFDSLSRLAVPLFVMISGALLLDEEKPFEIKTLLLKRVSNIFLLLISWSAVYA